MKYRPDVDGLRAVAVIPVVFFHAHVPYLYGGFLGVDVFFVISGYLITGVIVEEIAERRFSIVNFYERRARRILPALFLVVASTILAAPFFLNPSQLDDFSKSVIAVLLFVSNIFWQQSGYFGTASETSPMLHTWSLAVEEQYYIFFPLLLLLVWRYARNRLWLALSVVIVGSIGLSEWGWRNASVASFYLLPTRAWELLIGSLVALALRKNLLASIPDSLKNGAAFLGLIVLLVSFVLFDDNTPHPSLITLIPVLATAAIIAGASPSGATGRLLAAKPLVAVGLMSYSLYLWHQPMFAFAKLNIAKPHILPVLLALSAVSMVIAYFSWRYWEKPFRKKAITSRPQILHFSAISIVVLGVAGLASSIYRDSIFSMVYPDRYSNYKAIEEATAVSNNPMINRGCHIHSEEFTQAFRAVFRKCVEKYGKGVFVTGGSHGMDLYNSLAVNSEYPFIASVSRGYCRAHTFLGGRPPHRCHYDDLLSFATENANNLSVIIYTQTADRLFHVPFSQATARDLSKDSMAQVVAYLKRLQDESGVRTYMIGMLPILSRAPASLSLTEPVREQLSASITEKSQRMIAHIDREFARMAGEMGILYVAKIEAMSLKLPEDLLIDGKITYSDERHLSSQGEKVFGRRLVDYLTRSGLLPNEQNGLSLSFLPAAR